MRLDIRYSGVANARSWDADLESVLLGSLDRFKHWVKRAYLYVEDVNGPKGGVDKQCRCVLHLRRMPPVVIQAKGEDLIALIYRIANRASYTLSQKTKRRRSRGGTKRQRIADET